MFCYTTLLISSSILSLFLGPTINIVLLRFGVKSYVIDGRMMNNKKSNNLIHSYTIFPNYLTPKLKGYALITNCNKWPNHTFISLYHKEL